MVYKVVKVIYLVLLEARNMTATITKNSSHMSDKTASGRSVTKSRDPNRAQ